MTKVLDFGSDGEGLPFADWVESPSREGNDPTETPFGHKWLNVWVKEGSPIPAPDFEYSIIHAKYSMCWNSLQDWRFIYSEFKRLLARGGMIVITDLLENNEVNGYVSVEEVKKVFNECFDDEYIPYVEVYYANGEEDQSQIAVHAVIYKV